MGVKFLLLILPNENWTQSGAQGRQTVMSIGFPKWLICTLYCILLSLKNISYLILSSVWGCLQFELIFLYFFHFSLSIVWGCFFFEFFPPMTLFWFKFTAWGCLPFQLFVELRLFLFKFIYRLKLSLVWIYFCLWW